jgi:hypothetical protein
MQHIVLYCTTLAASPAPAVLELLPKGRMPRALPKPAEMLVPATHQMQAAQKYGLLDMATYRDKFQARNDCGWQQYSSRDASA